MVQRSFIRKIDGMGHLDYWTQLKRLKLYSLERRRERYIVIYIYGVSLNAKFLISLQEKYTPQILVGD